MTFKTVKHLFLSLGLLISCNALYGAANDQNNFILNYLPDHSNLYVSFIENGSTAERINQTIDIQNDTANMLNEDMANQQLPPNNFIPIIEHVAPERVTQLNKVKYIKYIAGGLGLISQKLLAEATEHPKKIGAVMTTGFAYYSSPQHGQLPYLWAPEEQWQEQLKQYRERKALRMLAAGSAISLLASGAIVFYLNNLLIIKSSLL